MYILLKYGRRNERMLNREFVILAISYVFSAILVLCVKNKIFSITFICVSILFAFWQIILLLKDVNELEKKMNGKVSYD